MTRAHRQHRLEPGNLLVRPLLKANVAADGSSATDSFISAPTTLNSMSSCASSHDHSNTSSDAGAAPGIASISADAKENQPATPNRLADQDAASAIKPYHSITNAGAQSSGDAGQEPVASAGKCLRVQAKPPALARRRPGLVPGTRTTQGASLLSSGFKGPSVVQQPPVKEKPPDRYYSVLFCKRSNKKHKTYDDGLLVVSGRKCVLKTTEDKVITQRLVGFSTEHLGPEASLDMGNYTLEVGMINIHFLSYLLSRPAQLFPCLFSVQSCTRGGLI